MKYRQLISALSITFAGFQAHAGVLTGPIVNPANGHSYYLLTQNTWTASEAEAVTLGGHLATIDDSAENDWVLSTFSMFEGSPKTLWIGLTDKKNEGTFVWSSGAKSAYRNWSSGNPNNYQGVEDFVHIYDSARGSFSGFWNDYCDCTTEYGVPLHGVVEVVPPVPVGGSVSGLSGRKNVTCTNITTGQQFTFSQSPQKWNCEAHGLVVNPGDLIEQTVSAKKPLPK